MRTPRDLGSPQQFDASATATASRRTDQLVGAKSRTVSLFEGRRGEHPKSRREVVAERGGASIWQRVAEPMGLPSAPIGG